MLLLIIFLLVVAIITVGLARWVLGDSSLAQGRLYTIMNVALGLAILVRVTNLGLLLIFGLWIPLLIMAIIHYSIQSSAIRKVKYLEPSYSVLILLSNVFFFFGFALQFDFVYNANPDLASQNISIFSLYNLVFNQDFDLYAVSYGVESFAAANLTFLAATIISWIALRFWNSPNKTITIKLEEVIAEKKSNPAEIQGDEIEIWRVGFGEIGWLEEIGQNTKRVLSTSPDKHYTAEDHLLCVTYADIKGSRIVGLNFNDMDLYSRSCSLIATSQKLIFVQPENNVVKDLDYKGIEKIEGKKNGASTVYVLSSKSGDSATLSVKYKSPDDEKFVNMFLDRITYI